jgi:Zn-dependent peptidase ImmA (M78 family)
LEWLSLRWINLVVEQGYPLGCCPATPKHLRAQAAFKWADLSMEAQEAQDDELYSFEERHDLSRAMPGIILPTLLVMREGNMAWVCTENRADKFSIADVLNELSSVGDRIAEALDGSGSERTLSSLDKWTRRNEFNASSVISSATGIQPREFQNLPTQYLALAGWDLSDHSMYDSELAAVARSSIINLSITDRMTLIEQIKKIPFRQTDDLNRLSQKAIMALDGHEKEDPYEQGYFLANWLRQELGIQGKADPDSIIDKLGIDLRESTFDTRMDAIGSWGPKHGPVIIVNKSGKHAKALPGRNSTLAHELCHLLVDRQGALPLAEVLGGQVPYAPERRANAFAAEFLLPVSILRDAIRQAASLESALDYLRRRMGVGRSLTLNHLKNNPSIQQFLSPSDWRSIHNA